MTKHSNLNLIDRLQFPWLTVSIAFIIYCKANQRSSARQRHFSRAWVLDLGLKSAVTMTQLAITRAQLAITTAK